MAAHGMLVRRVQGQCDKYPELKTYVVVSYSLDRLHNRLHDAMPKLKHILRSAQRDRASDAHLNSTADAIRKLYHKVKAVC